MQFLKQSTTATIYVGPVLDSTGAAVTTAVLGDFRLVKNGTAATLTGATVTHDANGYYTVALTTTNMNTVGQLTLGVGNTAQAMATHNYVVLLASVYDAIITNATNATGGLPTATGSISALAGAISTYAGGAVASVTAGVTVTTNNDKTGYTVSTVSDKTGYSLSVTPPTSAQIATAVWQDTTAGDFTVASSIGKSLYTTGNAPGAASGLALVGSNMGTVTSVSGSVGSVTGAVGSVTGAVGSVTGNVGGNVVGSVGSVSGAVGSVTGNVGGNVTGSVGSIATGGITRASFAADTGLQTIRSNTAQAGASTSITLDASASSVNNFYNNALIYITGGTGVGQARFCTAYVGTTKVATVAAWATNPDATSTFAIIEFDAIPGATAPTAAAIRTEMDTNSTQLAKLGTPAGASMSADIAAINAKTTNLPASPASTTNITAASGITLAAVTHTGATIPTVTTTGTTTNLTNLPTIPTNWLTAAGLAADAVAEIQSGLATPTNITSASGVTLTSGERTSIADATLGRSVATVESTAAEWSLASMILAAFESSVSGTTWTIKRTDGTTVHLTKTVTTNAAADPITGVS